MQLELCDEDVQDQVESDLSSSKQPNQPALFRAVRSVCQTVFLGFVSLQVITSIGELVEMCSPQILSGWRPLFSALRTVHGSKTDTKDYLLGEYSMGMSNKLFSKVYQQKDFYCKSEFPALVLLSSSREVSGAGVRRLWGVHKHRQHPSFCQRCHRLHHVSHEVCQRIRFVSLMCACYFSFQDITFPAFWDFTFPGIRLCIYLFIRSS